MWVRVPHNNPLGVSNSSLKLCSYYYDNNIPNTMAVTVRMTVSLLSLCFLETSGQGRRKHGRESKSNKILPYRTVLEIWLFFRSGSSYYTILFGLFRLSVRFLTQSFTRAEYVRRPKRTKTSWQSESNKNTLEGAAHFGYKSRREVLTMEMTDDDGRSIPGHQKRVQ